MLLYIHIDAAETLVSLALRDYPSTTAATGSPFSGGSLANLGNGLWSVNIGTFTGDRRWVAEAFSADSELIAFGYAGTAWVDGSGNATVFDFPPWQQTTILDSTGAVSLEGGTIEINQGDSYDGTSNAKLSWTRSTLRCVGER